MAKHHMVFQPPPDILNQVEIRDPLHGTILFDRKEMNLLESAEFQRLRFIKQLGFAEYSFPGATHTRFLHSLGATHLATRAFDEIFRKKNILNPKKFAAFRQVVRLAALFHDLGHGPLSHTSESVMPPLKDLQIGVYRFRKTNKGQLEIPPLASSILEKRASHEDYTIKYITDSPLSQKIVDTFDDFLPYHIALLIDQDLIPQDDFFIDQGLDFRPILSQLISSELDCDRMDYLLRDSLFCGTNYGKIDYDWLISHLCMHVSKNKVYLALNRRALYTFDDFLLARHHMYLMVYFHHKSIIFEEFLNRYLNSPDCEFRLPSDINQYTLCTDHTLFENIQKSQNPWAKRIREKSLFKPLVELHGSESFRRMQDWQKQLEEFGIPTIFVSSKTRLSKYYNAGHSEELPIFVVDEYSSFEPPMPIDEATEIFQKYEGNRFIDRLYVPPERRNEAKRLIEGLRL